MQKGPPRCGGPQVGRLVKCLIPEKALEGCPPETTRIETASLQRVPDEAVLAVSHVEFWAFLEAPCNQGLTHHFLELDLHQPNPFR